MFDKLKTCINSLSDRSLVIMVVVAQILAVLSVNLAIFKMFNNGSSFEIKTVLGLIDCLALYICHLPFYLVPRYRNSKSNFWIVYFLILSIFILIYFI